MRAPHSKLVKQELPGCGYSHPAMAMAPSISALSETGEGTSAPHMMKDACFHCLASPCCQHLLHSWSKVGAEPEYCCSLAGSAHARGSTDMTSPCHLGPLQTLNVDKHRREAGRVLRTAQGWPAGAPWHEQPGHIE